MKTRFFVIVLLAAVVGFGACKKEKKSNKCELLEITIGGQSIGKNGTTFFHVFPKTNANTWGTWNGGNIGASDYKISDKASITPDPKSSLNYEAGVTFTVTAEDGTTKPFTVQIEKGVNAY